MPRDQDGPGRPYHLILVCGPLEHALGPLDVEEDVGKDPDGILVATHHQICETHVVVCGDLALRHPRIHALWREAEASMSPKPTHPGQSLEAGRAQCQLRWKPLVEALNYPGEALAPEFEALSADRTVYRLGYRTCNSILLDVTNRDRIR